VGLEYETKGNTSRRDHHVTQDWREDSHLHSHWPILAWGGGFVARGDEWRGGGEPRSLLMQRRLTSTRVCPLLKAPNSTAGSDNVGREPAAKTLECEAQSKEEKEKPCKVASGTD